MLPPLALRVTDSPGQTTNLEAVKITGGAGLTIMNCCAVPKQFREFSPVTINTVEVLGLTVTELPERFPGNFQSRQHFLKDFVTFV